MSLQFSLRKILVTSYSTNLEHVEKQFFLFSKHWFKRPFDFCLASLRWCHWQTRWFRKNHAKTKVLQIKMHPTNRLILSTMPRTGIVIVAPSNKLLDKTKPSAAKAQPEALFNKVMATGMSAPPTCGSETADNVFLICACWMLGKVQHVFPNGSLMVTYHGKEWKITLNEPKGFLWEKSKNGNICHFCVACCLPTLYLLHL